MAGSSFHNEVLLASTVALAVLATLVIGYGTAVKNAWGVNHRPIVCPRCGEVHGRSFTRRPDSAWFGEFTCGKCGSKLDKWGRELAVAKDAGGPAVDRILGRILPWSLIGIGLALNAAYDYYHPAAIILDIIIALVLVARFS